MENLRQEGLTQWRGVDLHHDLLRYQPYKFINASMSRSSRAEDFPGCQLVTCTVLKLQTSSETEPSTQLLPHISCSHLWSVNLSPKHRISHCLKAPILCHKYWSTSWPLPWPPFNRVSLGACLHKVFFSLQPFFLGNPISRWRTTWNFTRGFFPLCLALSAVIGWIRRNRKL